MDVPKGETVQPAQTEPQPSKWDFLKGLKEKFFGQKSQTPTEVLPENVELSRSAAAQGPELTDGPIKPEVKIPSPPNHLPPLAKPS